GSDFRRWVWITIAPFVTKNGGLLRYGNYCSVGKIQNRVSLKLQKTGQKNFFQLIFINRP
ncbi:hypothetical protein ACVD1L_24270, partial [Escherichia coli]